MTAEFWVRLIVACFPLIGTISLFVIMAATAKKKAEGTKCLIVIYDIEDEISRAKSGTMPVYRRELIVL